MKTLKDVVAERQPKYIDETRAGGVWGCPSYYSYLHQFLEKTEVQRGICPKQNKDLKAPERCEFCWNRAANSELDKI